MKKQSPRERRAEIINGWQHHRLKSNEDMGELMGVSGMTWGRWKKAGFSTLSIDQLTLIIDLLHIPPDEAVELLTVGSRTIGNTCKHFGVA